MFSLQTIFGKGDKFYSLLEASADAARQSTRALISMLNQKSSAPSLDEFRLARRREKEIMNQISQELVNTFVTALEREDIEALSGALYKIPKTVEKFAERYALFSAQLMDVDYASRAVMLEKDSGVIVEMVGQLRRGMKLEEMKAPTKLRIAAIATALRGERARVETLVAIEFAVSWKPFVKSKKNATATTATSVTCSIVSTRS